MRCAKIPSSRVCSTRQRRTASTSLSTRARTGNRCSSNLPHTSVRDLIVHGNDAIVATHGRGFWILDDVEPLRELAPSPDLSQGVCISLRRRSHIACGAARIPIRRCRRKSRPGENPPDGAIIDYALASPAQRVVIAIYDAPAVSCAAIRATTPRRRRIAHLDKPAYWERPFTRPSTAEGMHRFAWDLREPSPHAFAARIFRSRRSRTLRRACRKARSSFPAAIPCA